MKLYCEKCGKLVIDLKEGSLVRKGAVAFCHGCKPKESAVPKMPYFFKKFFDNPAGYGK